MNTPVLPAGKGIYIWKQRNILGGDPEAIVKALVDANVSYVVMKIHDGVAIYQDLERLIELLHEAGIIFGAFGYIYLKWNPRGEAEAANMACKRYQPNFYLIDAEAQAKFQHAEARVFAAFLDVGVPVGLNSYYRPDLHTELPWKELYACSDFVCPQIYWRNAYPVVKLRRSQLEYTKLEARLGLVDLPMLMVAGDMYLEYGLKPTPAQLQLFLEAVHQDESIVGAHFWSMDQMEVVPELWEVFANFEWGDSAPDKTIEEPEMTQEEFVTAVQMGLNGAKNRLREYGKYYYDRFISGMPITEIVREDAVIIAAISLLEEKEPQPLYRATVNAFFGLRVRKVRSTVGNTPLRTIRYRWTVTVWEERDENGYTWARISPDKEEWVAAKWLKPL